MAAHTTDARVPAANDAVPAPRAQPSSKKLPPGPRGIPLGGSIFDMWRDPLAFFVKHTRTYGDVVQFRFGPYRYFFVNDVESVRHLLVDNSKNYTKSQNYDGLKLVLGNGLVTSEGDFWRRQRKLAQPAFHRERLAGFANTMATSTAAMLERWRNVRGEGNHRPIVDIHAEMMRLTLHIVGLTLCSVDVDSEGSASEIGRAIRVGLMHANDYAESLIKIPPWVPTPANFRFRRAAQRLDELVLGIIEQRRKAPENTHDLLGMLMAARDDESIGMTDQQLRDEVMTMVLAGHETTANALTWAFALLSKHPDVERRLYQETLEVFGDPTHPEQPGGRTPTMEDVPKLKYTAMVIQEAMRLFPPVWVFERQAIADDTFGGYHIPKGSVVAVAPYALHRNPAYWENPEGFDPERFTPAAIEKRPKNAYLPFSVGPRQCIGNAFAMMEMQLIVAMVVRAHHLDLVPGEKLESDAKVTLRPTNGVKMELRPRVRARSSSASTLS